MSYPVYIGTVLLESNRWSADRVPTFLVSEWLPRFAADGFDGVELWENHAARCDEAERTRLEASPLPITVFNSYAGLDDAQASQRKRAAELATRLGASAVKFNFGKPPADGPRQARNARAWADLMPGVTRMLCECHPGTIMEDPDFAAATFASWADPRFQAIVHAFADDPGQCAAMLRQLGPQVVTHVHVSLRQRSDQTQSMVEQRMAMLRDAGFTGSFTLEFTQGTGEADEDRQVMYDRARRDLELIRKAFDQ